MKVKNMKITIRGCVNVKEPADIIIETIKNRGLVTICEIIIDGENKGWVNWNGEELSIGSYELNALK